MAWPSTDESATADEQPGTPKHRGHHHRHASNGSGAGFEASIDVCRSVERNRCVGRLETLNPGRQHFWLLVSFRGSIRGDRIGTQLRGPDGTIDAPDFTVRGGDGYAWAEITRSLRRGEWTAVATRNGDEVATAGFSVD